MSLPALCRKRSSPLAQAAVKESIPRLERALVNSGFQRPQISSNRLINGGSGPKQAASFDCRLRWICWSRTVPFRAAGRIRGRWRIWRLTGNTRTTGGALSIAIAAADPTLRTAGASVQRGGSGRRRKVAISLPASPGGRLPGRAIDIEPTPPRGRRTVRTARTRPDPLRRVRGQEMAKRAVTVAATGIAQHPDARPAGSGKTISSPSGFRRSCCCSTRQSPSRLRALNSARACCRPDSLCWRSVPIAAHITRSAMPGYAAAVRLRRPGEISLSHNADVNFFHQLPEFNRHTLEVLRQPLEDGTITISRALSSTTFPVGCFMLLAVLNPCPCGYRNDPRRDCHCTPPQIDRYMAKISGPLLDRSTSTSRRRPSLIAS